MAQMKNLNGYEICDQTARDTVANHTHNYAGSRSSGGAANALAISDTRNDNSAPNSTAFDKHAITADFKYNSKIGSPPGFGGTYCGLISVAPWAETSGGHGYQLAFGYNSANHPRLALRGADLSATSWGSWYKVYTSDDKPTPAEIGAATASHQHPYVHNANGTSGQNGYVQIAQFKITGAYQNAPIIIELIRRGSTNSCTLKIAFANASNVDPGLNFFEYEGEDYHCYIHKSAASTWNLYVQKSEAYDNIGVVRYHKPAYDSGITITWTNVHAASVPSGAIRSGESFTALTVDGFYSYCMNQDTMWLRRYENYYVLTGGWQKYGSDSGITISGSGYAAIGSYSFSISNMIGFPVILKKTTGQSLLGFFSFEGGEMYIYGEPGATIKQIFTMSGMCENRK